MVDLLLKVKELVNIHHAEVVALRRKIHSHPELSYQEENTSQLVREILNKLSIPYQYPVAKTGVVGILRCKNPDKYCVALRADMDALPIQEETSLDFKSTVPNVMHACGHDAHTATLLGVATILRAMRDELEGTYKFIFQPSEEKMPSGANAMIAEGVLDNPKVDAIFGWHVHPEMKVGEIGFRAGDFMASADEIYLTVVGKGGHAAQPTQFISPLIIAAKIILALENVTNLGIPLVLTFGKIVADGATNVVPVKATLAGTLRCFDESKRRATHQLIHAVCKDIADKHGAVVEVDIVLGYPVLTNDISLTTFAQKQAENIVSSDKIFDLPIRMGAEDFAFYSHQVLACFYRVGVGSPTADTNYPIHSAKFVIDESALKTSVALMSWLAVSFENK